MNDKLVVGKIEQLTNEGRRLPSKLNTLLYGRKPQLKCETKAIKTGEHCPEKPTRIVYDEDGHFFLCEKCYKTYIAMKKDKAI